jgi:hypothetical protein
MGYRPTCLVHTAHAGPVALVVRLERPLLLLFGLVQVLLQHEVLGQEAHCRRCGHLKVMATTQGTHPHRYREPVRLLTHDPARPVHRAAKEMVVAETFGAAAARGVVGRESGAVAECQPCAVVGAARQA